MKPANADVLRRIKAAGANGIHSFDLRDPRFGQVHLDAPKRVSELREAGFAIECRPEKRGTRRGVRYIFRNTPREGGVDPVPDAAPAGNGQPSPGAVAAVSSSRSLDTAPASHRRAGALRGHPSPSAASSAPLGSSLIPAHAPAWRYRPAEGQVLVADYRHQPSRWYFRDVAA